MNVCVVLIIVASFFTSQVCAMESVFSPEQKRIILKVAKVLELNNNKCTKVEQSFPDLDPDLAKAYDGGDISEVIRMLQDDTSQLYVLSTAGQPFKEVVQAYIDLRKTFKVLTAGDVDLASILEGEKERIERSVAKDLVAEAEAVAMSFLK